MTDQTSPLSSLGRDLRALRKSRDLTLAQLAEALGRSVGWLSQVERDLSDPTISDLRQISDVLNVPLSLMMGQNPAPAAEAGYVVRAGARRALGGVQGGLVEELLSPDLTDDFEVLHSTFAPGAALVTPVKRGTQELGYVLSGQLELVVGNRQFTVGPGDSFRIRNEEYRWSNPTDTACVVVWVIAPPVY